MTPINLHTRAHDEVANSAFNVQPIATRIHNFAICSGSKLYRLPPSPQRAFHPSSHRDTNVALPQAVRTTSSDPGTKVW